MFIDILVTLKRTSLALCIGASLGFMLGILLSYFRNVSIIEIVVSALMTLPGMALAPISILLFGFGDASIIFVGLIAAIFPILYNTIAGLKTIPDDIIEASHLDGCNYIQSLFSIQIPVASKSIMTGFEMSLAKAWRTVIAVEFVASTRHGLGYAIWDATEYLRYDVVLVGIIAIVIIHYVLNRMLKYATNSFVFKPG